jgi:hypothetical protein
MKTTFKCSLPYKSSRTSSSTASRSSSTLATSSGLAASSAFLVGLGVADREAGLESGFFSAALGASGLGASTLAGVASSALGADEPMLMTLGASVLTDASLLGVPILTTLAGAKHGRKCQ